MLSEAVATSATVRVAAAKHTLGRHALFLQSLIKLGRVRALDADDTDAHDTPLIVLPRIAAAVRALICL
jgi:mitochondrial fission protein ELM1